VSSTTVPADIICNSNNVLRVVLGRYVSISIFTDTTVRPRVILCLSVIVFPVIYGVYSVILDLERFVLPEITTEGHFVGYQYWSCLTGRINYITAVSVLLYR